MLGFTRITEAGKLVCMKYRISLMYILTPFNPVHLGYFQKLLTGWNQYEDSGSTYVRPDLG